MDRDSIISQLETIDAANQAFHEAHVASLPEEVKATLVKVVNQGLDARLDDVLAVMEYYFREGYTLKASRDREVFKAMSHEESLFDGRKLDSYDLLAIDIWDIIEDAGLEDRIDGDQIAHQIFSTHMWMCAA